MVRMKAEHYSKVQAAAIFAAFFFVAWFFILAPAYAATTTVTINLNPGWNLISQPFIEGFTIPTYTCQLQPNTKIWWFNADSSQQKYVAVDLNSLYNTVGGNGYWINVQSACTIAFSGTPATNLPLMHGWNLFGGIDAAGTTISQITSRCNIVYNTRIWGYDSDPSVKNYFPVSTASTLMQGAGYWIDIDSPSCGVPASSITTTTTTIATSSTTTTALSASSIVLNGHVTDTATVSPSSATGTVQFQVSTNGGVTFTTYDIKTLSGGSATSVPYTPPVLGTFYFRALYSGDSVYPPSQSGNTAEMLTVVSSLPTTSTTTTTTTSTSTTTTIAPTTTTTTCQWRDDGCGAYGCGSNMGQGYYCGGTLSNTRCVENPSCTTSTTSTTSTTTSTTTTTTTIPPVCYYTSCDAPVPDVCKCGIRTCGSGQYCCASYNYNIGICTDYSTCFISCGM